MSTVAAAVPVRRRPDLTRYLMAAWAVLVLVFLFIPIGLVILHSFNKGGAFVIWGNGVSGKWWDDVFDGGALLTSVIRVVVITALIGVGALVVERTKGLRAGSIRRFAVPLGALVALLINHQLTDGHKEVFDNPPFGAALIHSFTYAMIATVIAVVIGGLAGVALARRAGLWSKFFMAVLFLILVTPEIMDAIALLGWFVRVGEGINVLGIELPGIGLFKQGWVRLSVGQSLYASAVVTLIVRARLAGLDESLEEAAADLGAPPATAFRQITLPLISSALIAGGLLSFTLCLDNTIISSAVSTAGSSTFPSYVVGASRSQLKPFVGVGAVVLFAVTMAALAFVAVVLKRSGDSSSQIAATLTGS